MLSSWPRASVSKHALRLRLRVPRLAALALAAVLPLAGACTTAPATGERIFTGGMSLQEGRKLGEQQHPKLLEQFGGDYADPELQAYVSSIGNLLAQTSELPRLDWTFTVLNSPVVNAFALPGGFVYVSRGLIALADNEAQLASVLAHEIGHVTARHSAQRYGSQQLAGIASVLSGALLGRPAAQATSALSQVALASYSREQELEADTLGIRYLTRAGYDPEASAAFLAKLQAKNELQARLAGTPEAADDFSLLQTHPRTIKRVREAMARAETTRVADPIIARGIYLSKLDGLLYGYAPEQGYVRGRRFLHPELRLAFAVPAGFRIQNGRTSVKASGPDGLMVFAGAPEAGGRDPAVYLRDVWAANVRLEGLTRIEVNGMAGATALARARTQAGTRTVRLAAVRYDSDTTYRFLFVPKGSGLPERLADTVLDSFRKLSAAEAAALEPRRIRVHTVQAGETQQSLARRLPYDELPLRRFQVLNGLEPGARLEPGRMVKLIQ
ncbi:M48 family metalloprotease [Rhodovibrio sodomensis]|nr:M48 family metalloprotease [Rhodovibrio sodomensis]